MLHDRERAAIDGLWTVKISQDARELPQAQRCRNLEPDSAEFICALAAGCRATSLLEIGGSSGISTIALAAAARQTNGRLVSIEIEPARQAESKRTLADLGANLNLAALPETDVPLKAEEMRSADNGVGTTALVFAIINVHYDLAAVLIEKGANPNVLDLAGMGPLYAAADMNSLQWVQGRPAPILSDTLDGADIVRLLLQKGADANARLKTRPLKRHHDAGSTLNFGEGTTPLMRAARTGDVAVMKALLDGGANPFLTLPDGTNALLLAAGQGYGGVRGDGIRIVVPTPEDAAGAVALLLERGVDIDSFNTAGNTALHAAIARGDAVVKVLSSRHARLIKNKQGATPLDLASGGGGRGGRGGAGRGAGGGRGGPGAPPRESTLAILRQYYPEAKAN